MTIIKWQYGAPPRSIGDLVYSLILQRTGDTTARVMLVRDRTDNGYLCCPVVWGITGHVDRPEPVPDDTIIARWTTYVPPYIVTNRAASLGVALTWPDVKE